MMSLGKMPLPALLLLCTCLVSSIVQNLHVYGRKVKLHSSICDIMWMLLFEVPVIRWQPACWSASRALTSIIYKSDMKKFLSVRSIRAVMLNCCNNTNKLNKVWYSIINYYLHKIA